jgi:hypothetical protein
MSFRPFSPFALFGGGVVRAQRAMLTQSPRNILIRNNFSGWLGGVILTPTEAPTITALGRWSFAASGHTITAKLWTIGGVELASALITLDLVGYKFAPITPVSLAGNTQYILATRETQGGATWEEQRNLPGANGFTIVSSRYGSGEYPNIFGAANALYVPPNLRFI